VIGDDCEIGANTASTAARIDDTVLEEDVRLDNQIQIGHNVHIGAHTRDGGCSACAGSARIGRYCLIGGGAGVLGHLELCDKVVVTAMSLVTHSIREPASIPPGTPLMDNRSWRKNAARFKQLDASAERRRNRRQGTEMNHCNSALDVTAIQRCCRTAIRSCWSTAWSSSSRTSASRHKNVTSTNRSSRPFPGHPVMPGVLVIEALAQAGGLLTQLSHAAGAEGKLFYLVKIDNAQVHAMVVPGRPARTEVTLKRTSATWRCTPAIARVGRRQVRQRRRSSAPRSKLTMGGAGHPSQRSDRAGRAARRRRAHRRVLLIGADVEIGDGTTSARIAASRARPASAATTASRPSRDRRRPQDKKFAASARTGHRRPQRHPRVRHHQPRHRRRRRRHPHRQRQLAAGLHPRRPRLHVGNHCVFSNNATLAGHVESATTSSSAASPACTSSAASARTPSSAWARSSTATCRRT
jgi:3-hydroxymyristoyl/3-hydroxydecanoyl-(acyl carrier protein) dehydratase/carbonic anhydrase/acetyltransferase-like protein (isoleucine patch superfamily)